METYKVNVQQIADDMEEAGFDMKAGMSGFSDCLLDTLQEYISLEGDVYNELCKRVENRNRNGKA